MEDKKAVVAIVSNTTWSIYNFRLGLIRELLRLHYEVVIISPKDAYADKLEIIGCKHYDLYIDKRGVNPINDIKTFMHLVALFSRIRPDLVINYTVKPIVYSSLASKIFGAKVINVITGLGYAFVSHSGLKLISIALYRLSILFCDRLFFVNSEDLDEFRKLKIIKNINSIDFIAILPSEGIDVNRFHPICRQKADISFLLLARLLWDKGIGEYVEAARLLKKKYPNVNFYLMGAYHTDGISGIPKAKIEEWDRSGIVKYLGVSERVEDFISLSRCVVLPSYREGTGRTLVESLCMGIPVVATDVVGCRDVVRDGVDGFLCRAKDPVDLAEKMEKIILLDAETLKIMGENGRRRMLEEFDERLAINIYSDSICKLLSCGEKN